jgi:hypothetical protein
LQCLSDEAIQQAFVVSPLVSARAFLQSIIPCASFIAQFFNQLG